MKKIIFILIVAGAIGHSVLSIAKPVVIKANNIHARMVEAGVE